MTVRELIAQLKEYPEDTKVVIYNPDDERPADITGFLYGPELELCSDDID